MSEAAALATDRGKPFGFSAWFRSGDHEGVKLALAQLRGLGVTHLRTGIAWSDYVAPRGRDWFDWLIPTVAAEFELLPCLFGTPEALALAPAPGAPPRRARDYADFIETFVSDQGSHFEWLQLWSDPGDPRQWDRRLDPGWERLAETLSDAAYRLHRLGRRSVVPSASPHDPNWLRGMAEMALFDHVDAVAIRGLPMARDQAWEGVIAAARRSLVVHGYHPEIWISETGTSQHPHDLSAQLRAFDAAARAPADRVYWCARREPPAARAANDDDNAGCHSGLTDAGGKPVLLQRLLQEGGVPRIRELLARADLHIEAGREHRPSLITGGAGFIGTNLADRLLAGGESVIVFDSLVRPGTEENLRWLARRHGARLEVRLGDLRDHEALAAAVRQSRRVFHFAAQVAVTTSLHDPIDDFEVNGRGTLHLLESIRALEQPPPLLFTSTNKVYGNLPDLGLTLRGERWEPLDIAIAARGIDESHPLEFCSPYGCSKGVADQYVLDYAHSFGLPAAVFRMSCIYGPRQFGNEDQGWVAHFLIRALRGEPITLFGDGRQMRDILFVDDLVEALLAAERDIAALRGHAFNIGGGPQSALSLNELLARIERLIGRRPQVSFEAWRVADQRWFIADTTRFRTITHWRPRVGIDEGIGRLFDWLSEHHGRPALPPAHGSRAQ